MRSKKVTLSIPHRLWELLEKHAREVGYADARKLLTWSPIHSLLVRKPHAITAPIAEAPPELQDEIVEQIAEAYERGETRKGSYFEAVLEDIVQRLGVSAPVEVVRAVVAETVRHRPRKKSR